MREGFSIERPMLRVTCVVFGFNRKGLNIMLTRPNPHRRDTPWELPGEGIGNGEPLETAATRILSEETGLGRHFLEQLYTFDFSDGDPGNRTVTVAYYALISLDDPLPQAGNPSRARWFPIGKPPGLPAHQDAIFKAGLARLKGKLRYQPIGFELLPRKFKLSQLQNLYEAVLERPLDKRNFRRKILAMGLLKDLNEIERDVRHRAARLYRFDRKKYRALVERGFHFEL